MDVFEEVPHGGEVFEALRGEDGVDWNVVDGVDYEHVLQEVEERSRVIVVVEAALFDSLVSSGLEVRRQLTR